MNEGGTIIGEAGPLSSIFKIKVKNTFIEYILPPGTGQFGSLPPCDVYRRCSIPAEANLFPNQDNVNTCMEFNYGKGRMIIFPSGFFSLINDPVIKRKNFYSEYSRREMNERVSRVSKGSTYHYLQRSLENLFHFKNLPFVSLWPFPDGADNIFGFRVDTDFADPDDLKKLYSICIKNNIRASWFVETKSPGKNIDFFRNLEKQETGLHCFRHKVFNNYKDNFQNISEGINLLNNINIKPSGFAAPYGEWNYPLADAVNDLNFMYSSEFGYAYDSFPFYPFLKNSFSGTMQMPIHPVSVGRLHWGGHAEEEMIRYFEDVINYKLAMSEPIIFYTHPGEKRFHIFDSVFEKINSLGIPNYTLKEFAEWWKERCKLDYSASFENGKLNVAPQQENNSIWIKAVYPDKSIYIIKMSGDINLIRKKIEVQELKNISADEYSQLRKTTPRMKRHDILHTYRKMKQ